MGSVIDFVLFFVNEKHCKTLMLTSIIPLLHLRLSIWRSGEYIAELMENFAFLGSELGTRK